MHTHTDRLNPAERTSCTLFYNKALPIFRKRTQVSEEWSGPKVWNKRFGNRILFFIVNAMKTQSTYTKNTLHTTTDRKRYVGNIRREVYNCEIGNLKLEARILLFN